MSKNFIYFLTQKFKLNTFIVWGLVEGTSTNEGDTSSTMVGLLVFFVVFVFVVVFLGGDCLCVKSSTTLDLWGWGLFTFLVACAFLLGAIWTLDGNDDGELEAARMSKNKQGQQRMRETKSSNCRGILGRKNYWVRSFE